MYTFPPDGIFTRDLDKRPANYVPLSPLSFLDRSAAVFPTRTAIVHGRIRISYAELQARCRRLGSALKRRGVCPGDTVAIMSPNTPAMIESHFAVPGIGAVLNPLNIRLDPPTLAFILQHGEASVLLTDREFSPVIAKALSMIERKILVIDIDDGMTEGQRLGDIEYEDLLTEGDPAEPLSLPADEWQAMVLSYTSGTTGDPKGVVYHHRGTYLNTMANVAAWAMPKAPVYLWTLPIFHSLGWCFPWTVTLMGGTHVTLRRIEARAIFDAIKEHRVTHLCGAPIVLSTLINAKAEEIASFSHRVNVMTAASPPPPSVIERIERMGFDLLHVYGLTEVFGPSVICEWQADWDQFSEQQKAEMKARQGVAMPSVQEVRVVDPDTMVDVPRDGLHLGEVVKRSNTIMKGYLKNPAATAAAFKDGYFHTGDLAVQYPDGYIQLKDRSKDIIISGGENISSIELENILFQHPDVLDAAVVARPDEKWGETPCAFLTLKPGSHVSDLELQRFCRERLAGFKIPKSFVFGPIPKTATGKVQKFHLRRLASELTTPLLR